VFQRSKGGAIIEPSGPPQKAFRPCIARASGRPVLQRSKGGVIIGPAGLPEDKAGGKKFKE